MKRHTLLLAVSASAMLAFAAHAQQPVVSMPVAEPVPPVLNIPAPRDVAYPGVIKVAIDATDLDRRIFTIKQSIPVTGPGPMTILYPEWLPGNHSDSGQIEKIAGIRFSAGGRPIKWSRTSTNVYAFNIEVPAGATSIDLEFQYLSPTATAQGRVTVTPEITDIQTVSQVMYPAGYYARRIPIEASIKLPEGWKYATALETASVSGSTISFKTVPLDVFVDSPLYGGKNFKSVDLDTSGKSPVRFNMFADEASMLESKPEQIESLKRMVSQADKLFGARHFNHYDFLAAVGDKLGGIGLEHHRSTEIDLNGKTFDNWANLAPDRNVIPHEYVHSWDGKYRRGADQWTADLNTPMGNTMLWVYEGQTQYWGYVLQARSGMATQEEILGYWASAAATYGEGRPGRTWRNVLDTTNDPPIAQRKAQAWTSWQRSEDYYVEGLLIWLDADTLIREKTAGKKSLDDFARAFFGVNDGAYDELTYNFDTLVTTLNGVVPHDWAKFLKDRVEGNGPVPLDSLTRAGYRLEWQEKPTAWGKQVETIGAARSFTYSLGFNLNSTGGVTAVLWDSPAFKQGLTIGATVVAVNGETYNADRLIAALAKAKGTGPNIDLLIKVGDRYKTYTFDYHGGSRYPMFVKIDPKAKSSFDDILAAKGEVAVAKKK